MAGSNPTILIDTNVFLRVLIKEDEASFNDGVKLLGLIKSGQIKATTASITLAEVAWTLKSYYQFDKKKIIEAVSGIINLRGLKIVDGYDNLRALDSYRRLNVKYIDALLASIPAIQSEKWAVVSYDRDFDKLGVSRVSPRQAIASLEN